MPYQDAAALVKRTAEGVLRAYKPRDPSRVEVYVGQRAERHKYSGNVHGTCDDNDSDVSYVEVTIHAYDEGDVTYTVTHEMMHVLRFKRDRRSHHEDVSSSAPFESLLERAFEEGLAEALVHERLGVTAVRMGASAFDDPDDFIRLWQWREQPAEPHLIGPDAPRQLRAFLVDHRHYAGGYTLVRTLMEKGKWTLAKLIQAEAHDAWLAFLELRPDVKRRLYDADHGA